MDRIFVAHGFFVDRDRGNGKYDRGEPYRDENLNETWDQGEYYVDYPVGGFRYDSGENVGRAANYEREGWRRSTSYLSGCFVKVNNEVPFYNVTFAVFDSSRRSPIPEHYYAFRSVNRGGLVYVPVPPDPYSVVVTVMPEGVADARPLVFASDDFNRVYAESLERGYFVEHDFNASYQPPTEEPGEEEPEGVELPLWFVELFPFLVPLVEPFLPYLPAGLIPFVPLIALGLPSLLVLAVVGLVLRKRKSRRNKAPPNAG